MDIAKPNLPNDPRREEKIKAWKIHLMSQKNYKDLLKM